MMGGGSHGGMGGGYGGGMGGGYGGGMGGGYGGGINRGGGFIGGTFHNGGLHPVGGPGFYYRGGYGRGYYGGYYGSYWPYYGLGLGFGAGYWPGYNDYGYGGYPYDSYPYDAAYTSYQTSPNVTVVYPTQSTASAAPIYVDRARPVTREYDQFGQEIRPPAAAGAGSPVYLIAFNDHVIRAAVSYFVDGRTLHYVTLEREERQVPIDTVDRALSLQLNRERQVPFQLPAP
jgi:hypothetical protein